MITISYNLQKSTGVSGYKFAEVFVYYQGNKACYNSTKKKSMDVIGFLRAQALGINMLEHSCSPYAQLKVVTQKE